MAGIGDSVLFLGVAAVWVVLLLTLTGFAYNQGVKATIRNMGKREQAMLVNARRYEWLRKQHWSDSKNAFCVTRAGNIKLNSDVPSGHRLDVEIDKEMKRQKCLI